MDGHEQIGFVMIGDIRTCFQRNEHILFARVNDLDIMAVPLYQASERQGYIEIDVFFFCETADCTRVMPSMSRVNDKDKFLAVCLLHIIGVCAKGHGCEKEDETQV